MAGEQEQLSDVAPDKGGKTENEADKTNKLNVDLYVDPNSGGVTTGKEAGGEEQQEETAEEKEAKAEKKAKRLGWTPKDKFEGDPEDWQPASEWLEKGDRILGAQLRRERADRKKDKDEFAKRIERIERMNDQALKRQRETIIAKYEAEKRQAVKDADTDAFDKADKEQRAELKALEDEHKADDDADDKGGLKLTKRDKEAVAEFQSENPWFKSNRRLTAAMDDHFDDVNREMPGASMAERLEEARIRVEAEFPKHFGRKTNGAQRVEGGNRVNGGGTQRLSSKLPAEARAAAEKYVKEGLYKSLEDYAKEYFAEDNAA